MTKVYTVYSWVAKPGRDKEFVSSWQEFANWIVKQKGSAKSTRLFRDLSATNHFMSVDSWQDETAYETLRKGTEFSNNLRNLREFVDNLSWWPLKLEAEERS